MSPELTFMLLQYAVLVFSLSVHEAAHAAVAERCGDPSARLLGRVTLNPLAHVDPIGTVLMPMLMMFSGVPFLFGWAKPVPFNPVNLRNIRRDPVLIAIAGPVSNLLLAVITTIVLRVIVMVDPPVSEMEWWTAPQYVIPMSLIIINLLLMLFNAIPVPPLDGHHVLHYFLPPSGQRILEMIGPFGILIAIFASYTVLPIPLNYLQGLVERFVFGG